jgi:hypothetical protein
MLAFSYMVHLLAYEFSRLRARRFALSRILPSAFDRFFFRHINFSSRLFAATRVEGIEQFL